MALPDGKVLAPHQAAVVEHMCRLAASSASARGPAAAKGLVVFHGMGTGKTVTALACALRMPGVRSVVVVAPKTVQQHWRSASAAMRLAARVLTHEAGLHELATDGGDAPDLLVVDEAHNMRTRILRDRGGELKTGATANDMLVACSRARHVLLLTGTPAVNCVGDLLNLMCAVHGLTRGVGYARYKALEEAFSTRPEGLAPDLLPAHGAPVSFFLGTRCADLPRVVEEPVDLFMTQEHLAWYNAIEEEAMRLPGARGDSQVFLNGVRRAANGDAAASERTWGAKLAYLEVRVPAWVAAGEGVVVYTAWRDYGIELVAAMLRRNGIAYRVVDGSATEARRAASIAWYNDGAAGRVLLFTAAGAEGMDLRGTARVVILEPHWNAARTEQAVARAVRRGSHSHLPEERRVVTVHRLVLRKPALPPQKRPHSVDEQLAALSREKARWLDGAVAAWARAAGIEAPPPPPPPPKSERARPRRGPSLFLRSHTPAQPPKPKPTKQQQCPPSRTARTRATPCGRSTTSRRTPRPTPTPRSTCRRDRGSGGAAARRSPPPTRRRCGP